MSNYTVIRDMDNQDLYHHGIKGQKWGVRRFQNEDGSLTPAGRKRYEAITVETQTIKVKGKDPKERKALMDEIEKNAKDQGLRYVRHEPGTKRRTMREAEWMHQYMYQGYSEVEAKKKAKSTVRAQNFVISMYGVSIGSGLLLGLMDAMK